ncbi:MAG: hypothetical protein P1U63_06960 [Coxiellaceae bacterium]|nr:hypothetical protein [Coxiellaceae bacterium]
MRELVSSNHRLLEAATAGDIDQLTLILSEPDCQVNAAGIDDKTAL